MNKIILVLTIVMFAFTGQGQTLNLDNLIECHQTTRQELTSYLQSKSSLWNYDPSTGMWHYSGETTSFIRKTEGSFYESEIILITNNNEITSTILEDINAYDMEKVEGKNVYVGNNYAVGFIWEENKYGDMVYSIHVMTKQLFYGN